MKERKELKSHMLKAREIGLKAFLKYNKLKIEDKVYDLACIEEVKELLQNGSKQFTKEDNTIVEEQNYIESEEEDGKDETEFSTPKQSMRSSMIGIQTKTNNKRKTTSPINSEINKETKIISGNSKSLDDPKTAGKLLQSILTNSSFFRPTFERK